MKLIIIFFVALSTSCFAGNPKASDYMNGRVSVEIALGLQRAKDTGMPVVIVTFDANNKQMTTPYTLGGFFEMPETRKLLAENFVQIFAPWSARGMDQYRDLTDKTNLPVAIFIDKKGNIIERVPFKYGPSDALEKVQAIVSKL